MRDRFFLPIFVRAKKQGKGKCQIGKYTSLRRTPGKRIQGKGTGNRNTGKQETNRSKSLYIRKI